MGYSESAVRIRVRIRVRFRVRYSVRIRVRIRVSFPYNALIYRLQCLYNANSLLVTSCGTVETLSENPNPNNPFSLMLYSEVDTEHLAINPV